MHTNEKHKIPISLHLYISVLFLIALTILLTGVLCVQFSLSIKSKDQDAVLSDLALMIANMEMTRATIEKGEAEPYFSRQLDMLTDHMSQVDIIVLCNQDSIRLYHTTKERVGKRFMGDDEDRILAGDEPYISVAVGTMGLQRRAFHAVTGGDGGVIGFVMVSALQERIDAVRSGIIHTFLSLAFFMLLIGLIVAFFYSHALEALLMGHDPEEFVNLYIEREEVLNAMEEGLFAIDTSGNVTIMNTSARRMLDLPEDAPVHGEKLSGFYPETCLPDTVLSGIAEHDISLIVNRKNIISSRIPIRRGGKIIGAVSVFRNRTEVTRLAEKLTGTQYVIESLRTINHEFMNKLHIILGHLEMGEIDKARQFILNTSLISGEAVGDIHERVPIPSLAALLIGKLLRASELGIHFVLKSDSYFHTKTVDLPEDVLTTLVGNLVENAIDELNSREFPVKQIEVGIYSEEGHTTIVCDDTGGGIPEEILFSIYDPRTTTKGPGHGNGYSIMRKIVDRYEGSFHIDTEPGEGSSIEINLPI